MRNNISCSLPWAIRTAGILIRILDIFGGVFISEFPLLHDIWNSLTRPVFNKISTTHRSSQIFFFSHRKPVIQSKYYLITATSLFLSWSLIFRHIFFLFTLQWAFF